MVAPGAEFRGVTLLSCDACAAVTDLGEKKVIIMSKYKWRPKKKGLHRKSVEFLVQMRMETNKKKGFHFKIVRYLAGLWFHIIKW